MANRTWLEVALNGPWGREIRAAGSELASAAEVRRALSSN